MILQIDNNDSFTYNVVQLIKSVSGENPVVIKIADVNMDNLAHYDGIVFSPGPGLPHEYPKMFEILKRYDSVIPILGICLGFQAICLHYGGQLYSLPQVVHGMASTIKCDPTSYLFNGIDKMIVGRYHSWAIKDLPQTLTATAEDKDEVIMAIEHISKLVYGVQFHPESIITQGGEKIIRQFLGKTKNRRL